jgi:hypothetical protein
VRLQVDWAAYQPRQGEAPDFTGLDARVAVLARHGLDVLALVQHSPDWAASNAFHPLSAPRDNADYANFLIALIARYGPQGTFWESHPDVPRRPVRAWQVWNEPNLSNYFYPQPYPEHYPALLCAAYRAVHGADPGAKVVMAGLANYSWRALAALERAHVHGCFDVAAVHPYSGRPSNSVKIARLNRQVLDAHGDRSRPIWLTELTWSSALGKTRNTHGWETTAAGQAQRLTEAYRLYVHAARSLRLQRIYWYTWVTRDGGSPNSFEWSGLREERPGGRIVDKPAMRAFRRILRRYE